MMQSALGILTRRVKNASQYSWQGLRACFRHEEAFRVELALAAILFPLAFVFAESMLDLALLFASVLLVLIVELLNSALEAAVDLESTERSELAGRAKDMGSAAVLLSMLVFLLVWGALGWQNLLA